MLQRVAQDLGDAFPGIDMLSGVCGGEATIVRTRILVWLLEQARRLADENVAWPVVDATRATLNRRHFVRLHADAPLQAGIIVCTFDPDFAQQRRRIDDALRALEGLAGQLLRIDRPPHVRV